MRPVSGTLCKKHGGIDICRRLSGRAEGFMRSQDRETKSSVPGSADIPGKRQIRNSILLAISLAGVFLVLYMIQRTVRDHLTVDEPAGRAVIQIDGEKVHTMELDKDAQYRAETADGNYNMVIVKDQSVRVSEADCENQVCVKTGAIRYPGEVIACMPHRMIIYIE